MKKILHIIATPRGEESRTLKVSEAFLAGFKARNPDYAVEELDLSNEKLPALTAKRVDGKYILLGGKDMPPEFQAAWKEIAAHINRFLSADKYLLSSPMWNFSIPYMLKHYIDVIVQPKYLFRYTENGAQGLATGKKMAVITSRGGEYGPGTPAHSYDFQEPYLRTVFGFVGITDIVFINAEPMDASGAQVQADKIKEAQSEARELAKGF